MIRSDLLVTFGRTDTVDNEPSGSGEYKREGEHVNLVNQKSPILGKTLSAVCDP